MAAIGTSHTNIPIINSIGALAISRNLVSWAGFDRIENNCSIRPIGRVWRRSTLHRCCVKDSPTAATTHPLKAVTKRREMFVT